MMPRFPTEFKSMDQIFDIYNQFLSYFPSNLHGVISIALAVLIVIATAFASMIYKQFGSLNVTSMKTLID